MGNFDCDEDVDGMDASTFKADFGRSAINRPCTNVDLCNGDFSCNGNVDGSDAALFKNDFGRSSINNPCPICVQGTQWCVYPQGSFSLTSDVGVDGGTLPAEYTCDGAGYSPELSWSNAPSGTKEFALMMTTLPGDGTTKWSWVLYSIPATTTSLAKNSSGVGILGGGSNGATMAYEPPCSQGPGAKLYTFTLYALSESPQLPDAADEVTGDVLTQAISSITLGSASLNLSYTRP
jgi:phosphatidylethanolamine-binding protein (PEBP) family uncharacterized protein